MNYQKAVINEGTGTRRRLARSVRRAYLFLESWVPFAAIAGLALYIGRLIELGKIDSQYGVGIIVFTLVPLAMHARNVREFNRLHRTIRDGGMPLPPSAPPTNPVPEPKPGAGR